MLTRLEKDEVVNNIAGLIDKSSAIFLTNLIGTTSNQANDIRKMIRTKDGKVVIARNTLFKRAAANNKPVYEMLKDIKGTSAVVFAFKDAVSIAKVLKEANAISELVTVKSAFMDGLVLSTKDVLAMAELPSKEQLLATMLATMMAPISALVRVLDKIKEKIGE